MSRINIVLALISATVLALAQQTPQDSAAPTFRSQSNLVLVPFHVTRGNHYVQDLKVSDVVLLEDGRPRDFTIFEGPAMQRRTPVELVLLFDTTRMPMGGGWRVKDVYDFTDHWDEAMSQAVLERGGVDVRVSVYHFDAMQLERLRRPTSDPKELFSALQALLTPMPIDTDKMTPSQRQELGIAVKSSVGDFGHRIDQPGAVAPGDYIPLELPPNRKNLEAAGGPGNGNRAWPLEAAIGTLKDSAASPDRVLRMMIMFSMGFSGTTTIPEDVAEQAVALGVPIYPVLTHSNMLGAIYWSSPASSDFFASHLGKLGKLTGGRSFVPSPEMNGGALTAEVVREILEGVRNDGLSQYVVGFVPPASSGTPKERKLEIKLVSKSSGELTGGRRKTIY
jgi:hypothetical protein